MKTLCVLAVSFILSSGSISFARSPVGESIHFQCLMQTLQARTGKKFTDEQLRQAVNVLGLQQLYVLEVEATSCDSAAINKIFKTKKDWKALCPKVSTETKTPCLIGYIQDNPPQTANELMYLGLVATLTATADQKSTRFVKTSVYQMMLALLLLLESYDSDNLPLWTAHARDPYFTEMRGLEATLFQKALAKFVPMLSSKVGEMAKIPLVAGETKAPGDLAIRDLNARITKLKAKVHNSL